MEKELDRIIQEAVGKTVHQTAFRETLEEIHEELRAEGRIGTSSASIRRLWQRPFIAAAAVIVLAFGIWWLQALPGKSQQVYAAHFEPLSTEAVTGTKGTANTEYSWSDYYYLGDYEAAARLLNTCLSRQECSPFHRVYLGIAYLEQGKPEIAAEAFKPLSEDASLYITRRNLARYYLALAYVRQGDYDLAIIELDKFIASDNSNNPYYEKAKALRKDLY